ncbi:hypothetical protein [Streptomyces sp. NPDC059262]|uniref:hypothetical protein n=1 Tax=Streptomyces sp. NPDC059262 TaxID=3346797 RepID=UPI0036CB70B9
MIAHVPAREGQGERARNGGDHQQPTGDAAGDAPGRSAAHPTACDPGGGGQQHLLTRLAEAEGEFDVEVQRVTRGRRGVRGCGPAAGSSWCGTLPHWSGSGAIVVPFIRDGAVEQLTATAAALRPLRGAVVERINQGMTVDHVVHDIDYPA